MTRAKGGRVELTMCRMQYIIDHKDDIIEDIAVKLDMHRSTVSNLLCMELGIRRRGSKKRRTRDELEKQALVIKQKEVAKSKRPKPAQLARWNNYEPYWTAVALERYGYGDMSMSKVLKLCEVEG